MKKLLLSLMLCCSMTGCVPLVVGGVIAVGAAVAVVVIDDHRTQAQKVADSQLAKAVEAQLATDPALNQKCHLSVAVFQGTVLLVGQAPTADLKSEAQVLAAKTAGIARLFNEIQVMNPSAALSRMSDAWLTSKVKTALLAAHYVHSGSIAVVVSNATVYLMGKVPAGEASLAEHAVSGVGGVEKVVSVFEIVPDKS